MMDFYEADSILQILFLIFSQFTVILLASGIIFLLSFDHQRAILYTFG